MTWSEAGTCVRATQIGPDSDRLTGKNIIYTGKNPAMGALSGRKDPTDSAGNPVPRFNEGYFCTKPTGRLLYNRRSPNDRP